MDAKLLKEFRDACETILNIKTKKMTILDYAKSYAKAGLYMYSADVISIQILYILNNLQYWRGEEARNTKKVLKRIREEIKNA